MPIYEYSCPSCGRYDSKIKPMSESDSLENCQDCGKQMQKQVSMPHVKWSCDTGTVSEGKPTTDSSKGSNYKIGKHKNKIMAQKNALSEEMKKEGKTNVNRKQKKS